MYKNSLLELEIVKKPETWLKELGDFITVLLTSLFIDHYSITLDKIR